MTKKQLHHLEWGIVGFVLLSGVIVTLVVIHEYNKLRALGGGFIGNFVPTPPGPLKDV